MPGVKTNGTMEFERKLNEWLSRDYNKWRSLMNITSFDVTKDGQNVLILINDDYQGFLRRGTTRKNSDLIIDEQSYIEIPINQWAARNFWTREGKWRFDGRTKDHGTCSYKSLDYKVPWGMELITQFANNFNVIEEKSEEHMKEHYPHLFSISRYKFADKNMGVIIYGINKEELCKNLKPLWADEPTLFW